MHYVLRLLSLLFTSVSLREFLCVIFCLVLHICIVFESQRGRVCRWGWNLESGVSKGFRDLGKVLDAFHLDAHEIGASRLLCMAERRVKRSHVTGMPFCHSAVDSTISCCMSASTRLEW